MNNPIYRLRELHPEETGGKIEHLSVADDAIMNIMNTADDIFIWEFFCKLRDKETDDV